MVKYANTSYKDKFTVMRHLEERISRAKIRLEKGIKSSREKSASRRENITSRAREGFEEGIRISKKGCLLKKESDLTSESTTSR